MSEDEFDHPLVKIGELMDEFEVLYFEAKDMWMDEKTDLDPVCQKMYQAAIKLMEANSLMCDQVAESQQFRMNNIGKKHRLQKYISGQKN